MLVQPVKGSKRLLAITQAVDTIYLEQLNRIDWLARSWRPDDHWHENGTFRRRILFDHCDLMQVIDRDIQNLIPEINRLCNTVYVGAASTWHICEPGFHCPMHTDGHKPNVMIVYWHTPGKEFGTTFYHSCDSEDVYWEFPGTPNTGFFAYYQPRIGRPWPEMWHASLASVPVGHYRLMTQYQLYR